MSGMRVMLAAETPLSEQWMNQILRKAGIETVPGMRAGEGLEDTKAERSELLLCLCESQRFLEDRRRLIHGCLQTGLPVIVAASDRVKCEALKDREGCTVLRLPKELDRHEADLFVRELLIRIKADYRGGEGGHRKPGPSRWLVAVGASTGGPKALLTILKELPEDFCAVLVVQHLTNGFSKRFSDYLSPLCRMQVREAGQGETVRDGTVYLAPDGFQTRIVNDMGRWTFQLTREDRKGGFCPSVDCLFESAALAAGGRSMGIILTGMGSDGAEGILKMRQAGAVTIGQDCATSDIYSMPMEAKRRGGIEREVPLPLISGEALMFHRNMKKKWGGDTDGAVDFNCR